MKTLHTRDNNFLNLEGAMALAADSITFRLDETQNFRPYFYIKGKDGIPAFLKHGSWDLGDMTGRYLESMVMTRRMIGAKHEWTQAEERLLAFLLSLLQNPLEIVLDIDKNAPDHAFAQGSALYGLVSYFEDTGDQIIRKIIEKFIIGLLKLAIPQGNHVIYPNVATANAPCSHMAGYQICPLVKFYELTGYEPALNLAENLSVWAFDHDDTIDSEGVIKKVGWEGHIHAWADTMSGIIQCSRLSKNLSKDRIVERCKKTYDWIYSTQVTDFGWVPDFPTSPTSETCAISSLMRLALGLIREGFTAYWNHIERFTRNQLIENQFREVDFLGIEDSRVAGALSGAFDCWAEPNTLFASMRQWGKEDDGDVEGCCVNGGMRGIFMAYTNAVTKKNKDLFINLLFDHEASNLKVKSLLPFAGKIVIESKPTQENSLPVNILVRIPDWANKDTIQVLENQKQVPGNIESGYIKIPLNYPGAQIEMTFDTRSKKETITLSGKHYELEWLGDTVLQVLPPGKNYPIYRRIM